MSYSEHEITAALMFNTEFSLDRFELVPDCYWIESVRKKTGLKDLFVFRHRKTGKFGLAQWVIKPQVYGQGVAAATEICLFSGPPGQNPADLPDMEWLMWRCQPEAEMMDEGRRKSLQARRDRYSALIERKNVLDEMERVLRKQNLDEAADKLSLDDVPDDGPELDQMRELLVWAASGKIISTG
jgi:hypothetical protein